MEHEIPASQKDRGLPMIINLRGDEELVDDFTWDAEQVMEFLSIKRSRLTQISGKELRVARIRRDRYLRPVYREADVRDYQEWTRATATHQSSSRAIEQAIDSLDDRFSDLIVILQEKIQQFEERSAGLLQKELHSIDRAGHERYSQLLDQACDQNDAAARLGSLQEKLLQLWRSERALLEEGQREQTAQRALLGSFHQDLRELLLVQSGLKREIQDLRESLQTQAERRLDVLQGMQKAMRDLQEGQERMMARLEPEEPKPPIMARPRRHRLRPLSIRVSRGSESAAASPQSNP